MRGAGWVSAQEASGGRLGEASVRKGPVVTWRSRAGPSALPGLGFAQFTLLSPFDYVAKYIWIFFSFSSIIQCHW